MNREPGFEQDSGDLAAWLAGQLAECPTRTVPIGSLTFGVTPRGVEANIEHVQTLSAVVDALPPIVVHEPTGEVVDGVHRVRAAQLRGERTIRATFYPGTADDAFAIAVRLNSQHGLPLSRAERTVAARRLLRSHAHWSNRMIAGITALSDATIRGLRRESGDPVGLSTRRLGKDGRSRPVNGSDGRLHVRNLLADRPTASARSIAQEAGVSVNTVLDVKRRLTAGEDVLTSRGRPRPSVVEQTRTEDGGRSPRELKDDAETLLSTLAQDPSMRHSDKGRLLLGWMNVSRNALNAVDEMPEHWVESSASLARAYSALWRDMAERLEKRRS
ncbi:ParB/RepB/Spo0J family partition protein [Umezawaea sp. NPDC059074]|uniref:ParB/RepB/Spo0J family partition protein n=1 Tax=Umezawaea sp. NPDC059074 TaxID=3346716 RepID=UPI0036AAE31C